MNFYCIAAWLMAFLWGFCPKTLAQTGVSATVYVDSLNRLAHAWYGISADSAFRCGRTALDLAGKAGYQKGEAESWRMLGNTYEMIGDYMNMLRCYQRSLDIAEKIGNPSLVAKANINIALFYKQEEDYDRAKQLMEKVQDISRRTGDSVQAAYIASYLADIALREGKYDQALQYARRAVEGLRKAGDEVNVASSNNDVGRILAAKGDYAGALQHYLESLAWYRGRNEMLGRTATNSLVSEVYLQLGDYRQALQYANDALAEARLIHRKPEVQRSARVLAEIYEAKGDPRNALRYFKLYKEYSDSLYSDQSRKQLLSLAAQYEVDRQTLQLREAQAAKDAAYEASLHKAQLQTSVTVAAALVLSLLAIILFSARTAARRMNRMLREKNGQIEDQKEILEQQAVQLLLSNQQKDKLFTIIAHDLRGPLNSLKALMDLVKEKRLSEHEIATMMNELRQNVHHSSELVSNLLYWASSRLNGMVALPVLLEVDKTVEEVLALFAQQAKEKGILLRMEIAPTLRGYADKDMTQVVIRNLVSNAIKFTNSGGVVTVNACRKDTVIEIVVTDTGIGMQEEALQRIRRKESFTSYGTAKEKGTGLGVLLCHEFAEANNGRFFVESEWGKGSRCYFTIPAAASSSSMRL